MLTQQCKSESPDRFSGMSAAHSLMLLRICCRAAVSFSVILARDACTMSGHSCIYRAPIWPVHEKWMGSEMLCRT